MESAQINRRFLDFFAERGHSVVPSASLIADDPTLLLINAGMAPFKPYFLGEQLPPWPRATSIQKCVRTVDIEEVGRTTRHGSFFQMAGNFSFGDYFKERAIPLAWELLTASAGSGGFGLAEADLWVTVYLDDDEAEDIWRREVGVSPDRIQRRGMLDNFWSMGVPGPCGPASEVCVDRGPSFGSEGGPEASDERYLELWNLVFMQSVRGPGGAKEGFPIVGALPARNIDTGLGVERLAMLLQGVDNIFETDGVRAGLDRAAELAGVTYGAEHATDVRLRVVGDHIRTAVMLVGDGVVPGNEGRGYVLRRILRRTVRTMRLLGVHDPVAAELAAAVRDEMGPSYPEVVGEFPRIEAVVRAEEDSFLGTLATGTRMFASAAVQATAQARPGLSGREAFTLHDTYGFPIDLTMEMAAEQGLSVDEDGFRTLMAEQRTRAKQDAQRRKSGPVDASVYAGVLSEVGATDFRGYTEVATEVTVRGLLVAGSPALAAGAGTTVDVVLDRTPFYAESGGQLADQGVLRLPGGTEVVVTDVQKPLGDLFVHRGSVVSGEVLVGTSGSGEVDVERRRSISRSHTATHLVHQAIRRALGDAAAQAGSENAPGRLRFDFSSPTAVPHSVLGDVEQEVNEILLADLAVHAFVTSQDEARRIGAIALFGEKYGDRVRVVEVGDYARELCGGTHAARSGQVGLVKLLGEASIGAGVRRVTGLVGLDAFRFLAREHVLVTELSELVKAPTDGLRDRVAATIARLHEAEKELGRLRMQSALASAGDLAAAAADIDGAAVVASAVPDGVSGDLLRRLALETRGRLAPTRPGVVALVGVAEGKPGVVVAVNEAGVADGLAAGDIVRLAAAALGGRGGGKPDLAQGGGADPSAVPAALAAVTAAVAARVRA